MSEIDRHVGDVTLPIDRSVSPRPLGPVPWKVCFLLMTLYLTGTLISCVMNLPVSWMSVVVQCVSCASFLWEKQPCKRRNLCGLVHSLFFLFNFLSGARSQRLFTASPLRENLDIYRSIAVTLPKAQLKYHSVQVLYHNQILEMRRVAGSPGSLWWWLKQLQRGPVSKLWKRKP